MPLEVKLGPTIIQLNPPSSSLLTIDDITLHPVQDPGTYEYHTSLSFEPGTRNNIVINLKRRRDAWRQGHFLHDIELLDESGLAYPRDSRHIRILYSYSLLTSISIIGIIVKVD